MKKETEENIKMIWSIFAIIGIFSTLVFIYNLFDKDDNTSSCSDYEYKIEELENELENLKSDLSSEEYSNRGLESKLESCEEELNLCSEDSEKYKDYEWPKLTDGPSGN